MQTIKLYTKGIHSYIKEINKSLTDKEFTTDGFNVHFKDDESIDLKQAHIATIITTTDNDKTNGVSIHYTIGDSNEFLQPANPLVSVGEYFKNNFDLQDNSGVVIGSIIDWRDPISEINLDIEEEIDPQKLYFCVISLKPFFRHMGIMGVVYGDLEPNEKEQLLSGEFYDPNTITEHFPNLTVAPVEYNMNVDKWCYELYTGEVHANPGEPLFHKKIKK